MPIYADINLNYQPNASTGIPIIENRNSIEQSMKNILLTRKGSRYFDPLFGTNIHNYLFDKLNVFTGNEIKEEINFALGNYEPRIIIDEINVNIDYEHNKYSVDIEYTIIKFKKTFNLFIDLELQG